MVSVEWEFQAGFLQLSFVCFLFCMVAGVAAGPGVGAVDNETAEALGVGE